MVGNITNLSEARYCAGMGVHFLAFPVDIVNPKMYQDRSEERRVGKECA